MDVHAYCHGSVGAVTAAVKMTLQAAAMRSMTGMECRPITQRRLKRMIGDRDRVYKRNSRCRSTHRAWLDYPKALDIPGHVTLEALGRGVRYHQPCIPTYASHPTKNVNSASPDASDLFHVMRVVLMMVVF